MRAATADPGSVRRPVRLPAPGRAVDAALAQLTPEHRQVITEIYFYGHSVAETAEILGISPSTVQSRSYYAVRQLRRAIPCPACSPSGGCPGGNGGSSRN